MDYKKLEWLRELEPIYPNYLKLNDKEEFPHVFYLHEKKYVHIFWRTVGEVDNDLEKLLVIWGLNTLSDSQPLYVRLTATGIDAIAALKKEFEEKEQTEALDDSKGILNAITEHKAFQEGKDWILTFLAKYASEIIPK